MSILIQTQMQHPRHSPDGDASTCTTLPMVFPIVVALALFIRLRGRLWI